MSIRSSRTEEARAARARRASRSAPSAASDSPATESGSKSARAKAPPADDWAFVERVLASPVADAVYVWGPPGTGKTFAACHADRGGRELFNVTLTPETPAAELRGFFVPRGVEFVWQDGVFVEAMRKGARLVINEVAHASADVLAILHPLLESRETARLTLPNLETVVPAPGFQVVCTDNLPPDHLPPALRDRFKSLLHVVKRLAAGGDIPAVVGDDKHAVVAARAEEIKTVEHTVDGHEEIAQREGVGIIFLVVLRVAS